MKVYAKQQLLNKVARLADELSYDAGRLSTNSTLIEDALARDFSNAVDALCAFQRRLAKHLNGDPNV